METISTLLKDLLALFEALQPETPLGVAIATALALIGLRFVGSKVWSYIRQDSAPLSELASRILEMIDQQNGTFELHGKHGISNDYVTLEAKSTDGPSYLVDGHDMYWQLTRRDVKAINKKVYALRAQIKSNTKQAEAKRAINKLVAAMAQTNARRSV